MAVDSGREAAFGADDEDEGEYKVGKKFFETGTGPRD